MRTGLHSIIRFVQRKLGRFNRRDFYFNQAPNKNTRIEIHAIQNSSTIFVKVANMVTTNTYIEQGREITVNEWTPLIEFKFFPETEGQIKEGTIFVDFGEGWQKYSSSKIDKDEKIKESLKHLEKLIGKANRVKSYK